MRPPDIISDWWKLPPRESPAVLAADVAARHARLIRRWQQARSGAAALVA